MFAAVKKEAAPKRTKHFRGLSYSARTTLMFALIALMTALISAAVLAFVWEDQFQTYTRENLNRIAISTASSISTKYTEAGGWSDEVLSPATSTESLSSDLEIQVTSSSGQILYDSRIEEHKRELAEEAAKRLEEEKESSEDASSEGEIAAPVANGDAASGNAEATAPEIAVEDDDFTVAVMGSDSVSAPVMSGNEQVAVVRIRTTNTESFLTSADIMFREKSYFAIAIATGIAIVIASILGFFFSRGLVNPIASIARTAEKIKDGDLSARTKLTGKDEIGQLGTTFNEMAESIERDRMLERRLTTDVAHELRTPLMAIQATVEAMQDGVLPADEVRLSTVKSETMRLERLVTALLTLSRLENRSATYNEETINLNDLVSTIATTHTALLEGADLTLTFESKDVPVRVRGDKDMLRQATANLISNAARYTDSGGNVWLRVYLRDEATAAIEVQDTGVGISEEDMKQVFSRFWRAEESRNREKAGVGVGLSITHEIVELHKGKIEVKSTVGEGSTFTILLPRYVEATSNRPRRNTIAQTQKMKKVPAQPKQAEKKGKDASAKKR